MVFSQQDPTV